MAGEKRKIGIIGFGNMGGSIAACASAAFEVSVFDKDCGKTDKTAGLNIRSSAEDLVSGSEAILLAVKPQDFDSLLVSIRPLAGDKLVISIAAGITTGYIESALGGARVVRAMPNMGARVSAAQTGLSKGRYARQEDLDFAKELFGLLGQVWVFEESLLDAVTAISGSGPAYVFYDMEKKGLSPESVTVEFKNEYVQRLKQAGMEVGFDSKTALELAAGTVSSSIRLLSQTGLSPAELRRMVTSPKGTTEAALNVLSANGSWSEAAVAAKKRAQELSKRG
ncbi:MAG: pyrroline-5-carboxylate reductase [Candidatus Omnitrophica bacterium]|nr:pyrroline-5-carboxylate reductase [Candidatus Omnitrophota bacterium]